MSSAAFAYPHKSPEAFRTISEVAIELDVPQHVLRFWESRFAQIKPVKRAGGRRYYRPEDVDLLQGHPRAALQRRLHHQGRAEGSEGTRPAPCRRCRPRRRASAQTLAIERRW